MLKLLKATGIAVFFIFVLLSLNFLQAQDETLTITTYYPAPYGVYRELRSMRMAIGDNYIRGGDYDWGDEIDNNADLVVEGNVGIGTTSPSQRLDVSGQIHATGDICTDQGGGVCLSAGSGVSYTIYCFDNSGWGTPVCGTVEIGMQWLCDAGFTVQKALGSWGYCTYAPFATASYGRFLPPGSGCGTGLSCATCGVVGQAYVCYAPGS